MKSFPLPLFNTDGSSTRPLGMPMCQNRLAVPAWSYAMEIIRPRRVIEIGSYDGGLAIALGLHCWNLKATMYSYDRNKQSEALTPLAAALGVQFRVGDIWELEQEIRVITGHDGPTIVLCDGGDKPRELMTFAKHLKPGDVIAAHDFDCYEANPEVPQLDRYWPWSETKLEDGKRAAATHGLVPFMQDLFDTAGWLAYRKPI